MFSWFNKSVKRPDYTEKVWVSKPYKYQGLYEDVQETIKLGGKAFIFTHFKKTLEEIAFVLEQKKVNFYKFSRDDNTAILSFRQVAIFQADVLQNDDRLKKLLREFVSSKADRFCIVEHFPLRKNDDDLLYALSEVKEDLKPTFYIGLDDAVLKPFIGNNLVEVLEKLGMKPEESISHPLVTKSIANVQEKVEKQAKGNKEAYSVEEWLKANLAKE